MPSRKLYRVRRAAGLCVVCSQPSLTAYCADCYWASRKTENLGSYLPDFELGIHCPLRFKPERKVHGRELLPRQAGTGLVCIDQPGRLHKHPVAQGQGGRP
jgi:hypothetical protein